MRKTSLRDDAMRAIRMAKATKMMKNAIEVDRAKAIEKENMEAIEKLRNRAQQEHAARKDSNPV